MVWNSAQNAGIVAGHQRQIDWLLGHGLRWGDHIVFLDDDVYPTADGWLDYLTIPLEAGKTIIGCYGANVTADWQMVQATERGLVDIVNMSHTAVRAAVFLEGFEFPLDFGVCWHEDSALCLWAKDHGYEVQYIGDPELIGLHHDPHHKSTDDLYWRNWEKLKEQYALKLRLGHDAG
jgi:glycosyltransferase involved in cell wall biosynthesis